MASISWSSQRLTLNDRETSHGPAVAGLGNHALMVWKGRGADPRIFCSVYDGSSWSPQRLTSEDRGTSHAPAITSLGNQALMVWKGSGADARIFYSVYDGSSWSRQQLTSEDRGTSQNPAVTRVSDRALMVWKGGGTDQRIYYSQQTAQESPPAPHDGGSTPPAQSATLNGEYAFVYTQTADLTVQLEVTGRLLSGTGSAGRTDFHASVQRAFPGAGGVQFPPTEAAVPFTVTDLRPGTWEVTSSSQFGTVVCENVRVPGTVRPNGNIPNRPKCQ